MDSGPLRPDLFYKIYKINVIHLFIYLFLFLAVLGLRCGAQASHFHGFPCCRARALGARASVVVARGSVVVARRFSRSAAYVIFPDQGSNPCPLHWQADS